MAGLLFKFGGVGFFDSTDVAGELDGGDLHAEADPEVGDLVLAGVLGGEDFPFDSTFAEAAGNEDAIDLSDDGFCSFFFEVFGVDFNDFNGGVVLGTGDREGFVDGLVGVVELDVFSDDRDGGFEGRIDEAVDEAFPTGEVGGLGFEAENIGDEAVDLVLAKIEGAFVDRIFDIAEGDDIFLFDVAEHRDFTAVVVVEIVFGAADDDIGLDADFAEFGDGLLGGLGLDFTGRLHHGEKGDVDEADVFLADVEGELAEGFEEKVSFDIADRAADLGDDDVGLGVAFGSEIEALFDLVGDVGDELDGGPEVFAGTFVLDDGFEDLAGAEAVELRKLPVGEAFVVAEVEVGLGAVIEDVDLTVLVRRHGAGIDIEVGVEFLDLDLEAAVFEKGADGGGGESFSERGDDSSGDEDIFHCEAARRDSMSGI